MSVAIRGACLQPLKAPEWLRAMASDRKEESGVTGGSKKGEPSLGQKKRNYRTSPNGPGWALLVKRVCDQAKREVLRS